MKYGVMAVPDPGTIKNNFTATFFDDEASRDARASTILREHAGWVVYTFIVAEAVKVSLKQPELEKVFIRL